jgi:hypothetical protein
MDDYDYQNTRYTVSLQSSTILELYQTARISTISLTYFHYCLQNGNYTVNLHFAEIQFTKSHISIRVAGTMLVTTYNSLGRRIFDIYVQVSSHSNVKLTFFLKLEARTTLSQERLVRKGFNIEDDVGSAEKPLVKQLLNVNVTNNKMRLAVLKSLIGEFMVPSYQPSLYFLVSCMFGIYSRSYNYQQCMYI